MNTKMNKTQTIDCETFRTHLPDFLLEGGYAAAHPELTIHGEECPPCRVELTELQHTFALLDDYSAPEPSAFFDTRLHARLREAQNSAPEGFWERTRSFLQFSTGRSFRPALSGALAAVLLVAGGGTALQVRHAHLAALSPESSSAVNDLKVLDNNEQAEQQMGQLLDQSGSEDGDTQPAS